MYVASALVPEGPLPRQVEKRVETSPVRRVPQDPSGTMEERLTLTDVLHVLTSPYVPVPATGFREDLVANDRTVPRG